MDPHPLPSFLQIISAAVAPVVMLSACSTLILGLNNKHAGLSDRMRAAASEYRSAETTHFRRDQLVGQIRVFERRFVYTWYAVCLLYAAVILFVLTTMLIVGVQNHLRVSSMAPIALFVIGVLFMLAAACLELIESSLAMRTMQLELQDILSSPSSHDEHSSDSARRTR